MRCLPRLLAVSIFCFLPALAQNPIGTSTVTLGVGGETPPRNIAGESTGPVFNGNYEFRILKYLSLEAGVSNMLPRTQRYEILYQIFPAYGGISAGVRSGSFCPPCVLGFFPDRTRVTLLPFGLRGIAPLWNSRVDLFGGGGGA